ncbi:MAG: gamma-glutamylcyclotransferase family protein, partial [Cyanobacteria bacterium J06648_11]
MSLSMTESHCLLFVYGSLMTGEVNHARLQGSTCLGRDRLDGAQLLDGGPYPFLVLNRVASVWGECYRISSELLPALDAFEEHP